MGNVTLFWDELSFQANENKLSFTSTIEKNSVNHHFDKDVIEKIVSNLLSNALKYGDVNSTILFESHIIDTHLQLVVSNSNSELTSNDLPKLFERFYQTNTSNDGAGIGLALVKELVQLYEGTIDTGLNNQQLTVTVRLPLHSNLKHAIVTSTQSDVEHQPIDIEAHSNDLPILLVVDDHPEIRNVIGSIFESDFKVLQSKIQNNFVNSLRFAV